MRSSSSPLTTVTDCASSPGARSRSTPVTTISSSDFVAFARVRRARAPWRARLRASRRRRDAARTEWRCSWAISFTKPMSVDKRKNGSGRARAPTTQNVKETRGGPRAYRRVGTAERNTMPAATTTNAVAIVGSKCDGRGDVAGGEARGADADGASLAVGVREIRTRCATANDSASSSHTASATPSHVFHVAFRHRCMTVNRRIAETLAPPRRPVDPAAGRACR